jgi:hypothetical protein
MSGLGQPSTPYNQPSGIVPFINQSSVTLNIPGLTSSGQVSINLITQGIVLASSNPLVYSADQLIVTFSTTTSGSIFWKVIRYS